MLNPANWMASNWILISLQFSARNFWRVLITINSGFAMFRLSLFAKEETISCPEPSSLPLSMWTKALGTRLRAFPDVHAGNFLPFWFAFRGWELFSRRESKLSSFGVYCAFVFRDKVSFQGFSFSLTYWKQHNVSVCLFEHIFLWLKDSVSCLDRSSVFVPRFLHHHWIIAIYCGPCSVEFEAQMWLTA